MLLVGRAGDKAKGTRLKVDSMQRELTNRLMDEWDRAGLVIRELRRLFNIR